MFQFPCVNPTAPARCKAVGQPFQTDAVYLVCAKPGGLGQPGKADVHSMRCRIISCFRRRESKRRLDDVAFFVRVK